MHILFFFVEMSLNKESFSLVVQGILHEKPSSGRTLMNSLRWLQRNIQKNFMRNFWRNLWEKSWASFWDNPCFWKFWKIKLQESVKKDKQRYWRNSWKKNLKKFLKGFLEDEKKLLEILLEEFMKGINR